VTPTETTDAHGQITFTAPDGKVIGAVSFWNDNHHKGKWMAEWKPLDWRDCGLKRFKTARGAAAHVRKKIAMVAEINESVT
jgi:hypothetical protein